MDNGQQGPDNRGARGFSHEFLSRVPVNILLVLQPPNRWGWIQVQTCSLMSPCLKMILLFVNLWDHGMEHLRAMPNFKKPPAGITLLYETICL